MKTDEAIAHLVKQYGALPVHPSDVEPLLYYLREHGCSKIDCMRALKHAYHVALKDAKPLVHLSQTWVDVRAHDDTFHNHLMETIEQLGAEQPKDLSRFPPAAESGT